MLCFFPLPQFVGLCWPSVGAVGLCYIGMRIDFFFSEKMAERMEDLKDQFLCSMADLIEEVFSLGSRMETLGEQVCTPIQL